MWDTLPRGSTGRGRQVAVVRSGDPGGIRVLRGGEPRGGMVGAATGVRQDLRQGDVHRGAEPDRPGTARRGAVVADRRGHARVDRLAGDRRHLGSHRGGRHQEADGQTARVRLQGRSLSGVGDLGDPDPDRILRRGRRHRLDDREADGPAVRALAGRAGGPGCDRLRRQADRHRAEREVRQTPDRRRQVGGDRQGLPDLRQGRLRRQGARGRTGRRTVLVRRLDPRPQEVGGLDVALETVRRQPYGQVLLLLIAAGIACYGLFTFARARHLSR